LEPNEEGLLPSQKGIEWPEGKSATRNPPQSGLSGPYHTVPKGTEMPEGLGFKHDGSDVGGPRSPYHTTIYPTRDMTPAEFDVNLLSVPWRYGGTIPR